MIVGVVGNAEVLGLAEYVVALEGKGNSFLEKQFLDLGVQDILGSIVKGARITVVPIEIEVRLKSYTGSVPGPVDGGPYLIVESHGIVGLLGNGVPALVHTGTSAERQLKVVGAVSYPQALGRAQCAGSILVKLEFIIGVRLQESVIVHIPLGRIVVIVNLARHVIASHICGRLVVTDARHIADGEIGLPERDVGKHVDVGVERRGPVERHGVLGAVGAVPNGFNYGILNVTSVKAHVHRREALAVGVTVVTPEAMAEIRSQIGITEANVQRVGIVRNGNQLRHAGLLG